MTCVMNSSLNPVPAPDMGWAPILMILGIYGLAILAPLSVLIEACVLHWQMPRTRSFWNSLGNSFLMNLASGILGFGWVFLGIPRLEDLSSRTGGGYYQPSAIAERGFWSSVALYCMLSMAVEGLILMILDRYRHSLRRVWLVSLVANVLSYAALFGVLPALLN
jgi:hypothetical protein